MIVFRSHHTPSERAGIDFDPHRQSIEDAISAVERQVSLDGDVDDSLEILVQIGESPVLLSRESWDWHRMARLGTALLHEAEYFDAPNAGRPAATRSASAS